MTLALKDLQKTGRCVSYDDVFRSAKRASEGDPDYRNQDNSMSVIGPAEAC
jgi:hypothetical protein